MEDRLQVCVKKLLYNSETLSIVQLMSTPPTNPQSLSPHLLLHNLCLLLLPPLDILILHVFRLCPYSTEPSSRNFFSSGSLPFFLLLSFLSVTPSVSLSFRVSLAFSFSPSLIIDSLDSPTQMEMTTTRSPPRPNLTCD